MLIIKQISTTAEPKISHIKHITRQKFIKSTPNYHHLRDEVAGNKDS